MKIFKTSQAKKQCLMEDIALLVECKDWDVFKLKRAIAGRHPFPLFDLMMWLKFEDEHQKLISIINSVVLASLWFVAGMTVVFPFAFIFSVFAILLELAWQSQLIKLRHLRSVIELVATLGTSNAQHWRSLVEDLLDTL